ncbi:BRCA1-A complex subunit Abraxas 1-like [Antedon mediterranea]|uniref:BRCA1-A complex subunit Abraxas 1-like n=1 Tax=Antedon mediterranea TaxID=105859 RepID=UPI003AF891B2
MAKIKINGTTWGTLFFDHVNSLGDQEGFLIGDVTENVTSNISDSQLTTYKKDICTIIQSTYACERTGSFYNRSGHVNIADVQSVLQDKHTKVVGWYKFRRNTQSQISLRERAVHQSLEKALGKGLILAIFTAQQTWNQSTHTFGYQLFSFKNKKFVPLPIEVINLGDTSQSDYKRASESVPSIGSTYDTILNKYKSVFVDPSGKSIALVKMEEMNNTMQSELENISQELLRSEASVSKLRLEVEELRRKAAAKIPKRSEEIVKPDESVKNNTNEETDEKLQENIKRSVVNHSSPISPKGDFSLDELKSGNRKLSNEISMDHESPEVVKEAKEDITDPFAGLLSEMKNALKTSPGFVKSRQRLSTDEGTAKDSNRYRAFSDPPKNISKRNQIDNNLVTKEQNLKKAHDDSDVTSISDKDESFCQSDSPTF